MTAIIAGCVAVAIGAAGVVALLARVAGRLRLGQRREKWHDQTTGPVGAMFNALFLAALALSVVIAWQNYTHAQADTAQEAAAVTTLADTAGALPDAAILRQDLAGYTQNVINTEWSTPTATTYGTLLAQRMRHEILALPANQAAQEAGRDLDDLDAARRARLADTDTHVPTGLLTCLIITAIMVLVHGLLVGAPHSPASVVPLVAEAGVLAAAVWIVFAMRQPFHGILTIPPNGLRTALAQLTPTR